MAAKTATLKFDGYKRRPNVGDLPPARGANSETEIAGFKTKLDGYLKELYL